MSTEKPVTDEELAAQLREKLQECCKLIDALENRNYSVEVAIVGGVDGDAARARSTVHKSIYL